MHLACIIRLIRACTADGNYLKEVAADWYLYIWLDLGVEYDFKQNALLYHDLSEFAS